MKLIELNIRNFGSYKGNAIFRFEKDITIYQGPNGAGKSTMIEGIFYALYGKLAKENVRDSDYIALNKQSEISLIWEHQGSKYQLKRTVINTGKFIKRERELKNLTKRTIEKTNAAIEEKITNMFGEMEKVKNSIYAPQGQLHKLLSLTGEDLKKDLSAIFGIERYKTLALVWERLQNKAIDHIKGLEKEIPSLRKNCLQIPEVKTQIDLLTKEEKRLEEKSTKVDNQLHELRKISQLKQKIEAERDAQNQPLMRINQEHTEKKAQLEKIETSIIKPEQITDIEKSLGFLQTELDTIVKREEILAPFIQEIKEDQEQLQRQADKVQDRKEKMNKTIINMVEKSKTSDSPITFQKQEAEEFIKSNVPLLNAKIKELQGIEELFSKLGEFEGKLDKLQSGDQSSSLKEFIEGTSFIKLPSFEFQNLQAINIGKFELWVKEVEKEINILLVEKETLSHDLVKLRTNSDIFQKDVTQKEQILAQLISGKKKTCTECGTTLTPELRKSNQRQIKDSIELLTAKIKEINSNISEIRKVLEDNEFRRKLEVIEIHNLLQRPKNNLQVQLNKLKAHHHTLQKINELKNNIKYVHAELPKSWAECFDRSGVESSTKQLQSSQKQLSEFSFYLNEVERNFEDKITEEQKFITILARVYSCCNKFNIDTKSDISVLQEELVTLQEDKTFKETLIRGLKEFKSLKAEVFKKHKEIIRLTEIINSKQIKLKNPQFKGLTQKEEELQNERKEIANRRIEISSEFTKQDIRKSQAKKSCAELEIRENKVRKLKKFEKFSERIKLTLKTIRPKILNYKIRKIIERANIIIQNMPSESDSLRLQVSTSDGKYEFGVLRNGEPGRLHTVSGGELTGIGFALRVAIAKELSNIGILILDEPTYGLDKARRERLAEILLDQQEIKQMLVVTHDEIFNGKTQNVKQIKQNQGVSRNMEEELGTNMEESK